MKDVKVGGVYARRHSRYARPEKFTVTELEEQGRYGDIEIVARGILETTYGDIRQNATARARDLVGPWEIVAVQVEAEQTLERERRRRAKLVNELPGVRVASLNVREVTLSLELPAAAELLGIPDLAAPWPGNNVDVD